MPLHYIAVQSVEATHEPLHRETGRSGVGSGPWPSDDVDLGLVIQFLQDSLLFDRQDGVAD